MRWFSLIKPNSLIKLGIAFWFIGATFYEEVFRKLESSPRCIIRQLHKSILYLCTDCPATNRGRVIGYIMQNSIYSVETIHYCLSLPPVAAPPARHLLRLLWQIIPVRGAPHLTLNALQTDPYRKSMVTLPPCGLLMAYNKLLGQA